MDCSPPGSSVLGDSPSKNTGVGCHALLQGIVLTQGWNSGLLRYRQILSCNLSHQQLGIEPILLMGIGTERSKQSALKEPTV